MKRMAREFTLRERSLLLLLGVICVCLAYYLMVDSPVRTGIKTARAGAESLRTQLSAVEKSLEDTYAMSKDMESMAESGRSRMPSYNAENEEVDFLHQVLEATSDYYIGFSGVTRDGDLVRREISLQYRSDSYKQAVNVLKRLEASDIRCLIGDMTVTPAADDTTGTGIASGPVVVSCTATFYETMHDGTPDRELPEEEAAE